MTAHTPWQTSERGTLTVCGHLVVMAGSDRNKDTDRVEVATSRRYTHIAVRLPDTRTRLTGLVNLKARIEGGGLDAVCQEETAGTSQSGRGETARGGKQDRQKKREFKDASSFFFLFPSLSLV